MLKDNFTRKKCDSCNYYYDIHFPECPKCKTSNYQSTKKSLQNPLIFIDTLRLVSILLVWLLVFFVLPFFVSLITTAILNLNGFSNTEIINILDSATFMISLQFSVYIIGLIGIFFILKPYLMYFLNDFKKYRNILLGALIGLVMICCTIAYNALVTYAFKIETNENQISVEMLIKSMPILAFFTVCIVGPIFEELIFRTALFGLGYKINKYFAYIVSIIIFSLVHMSLFGENVNYIAEFAALPSYIISAWFLSFIYDRFGFSGSLTAHIINNLLNFVIIFIL